MNHHGFMNASIRQNTRQLAAGRVRKRHVDNDSFSKKSGRSVFRAVEELVGNEKLSRTQVFLQRPYRAYGHDALHAQQLHRVNVRAVIYLAWEDALPAAAAGSKRHPLSFQPAKHDP